MLKRFIRSILYYGMRILLHDCNRFEIFKRNAIKFYGETIKWVENLMILSSETGVKLRDGKL